MELGTGIFLSSILISFVLLFTATKDRWNWRKIFGYPLLALALIGLIGGAYYYFEEMVPKPVTGVRGVELGMTYNDVVFNKGKPNEETKDDDDGDIILRFEGMQVTIDGVADKVSNIWVFGEDCWQVAVANVSACDDAQDLVAEFGQPSYMASSDDGIRRVYAFAKYNLSFALRSNKVEIISVFEPSATRVAGMSIEESGD